jgi:hypothetical protein
MGRIVKFQEGKGMSVGGVVSSVKSFLELEHGK